MINETAAALKALGEPTRLAIMKFLSVREMCICELTAVLNMSQPRVSQHVKVLKTTGLVLEKKVRQKSYFRINPEMLEGGSIHPFVTFMQIALDDVAELAIECNRFENLDNNKEVQECKAGCNELVNKKIG